MSRIRRRFRKLRRSKRLAVVWAEDAGTRIEACARVREHAVPGCRARSTRIQRSGVSPEIFQAGLHLRGSIIWLKTQTAAT